MSNLVESIDSLEDKIAKLLQRYKALEEENAKLEEALTAARQNNNNLKNEISTLHEETQMLKTANAMLGSNEYKRETKLKINRLIKQIDHCIVQLSE